jgi:MoaA/NifB/PqqE/SkfB family radical SAM enzyme
LIAPQGDVYPCCFLFDDNGGYTESAETARLAHRLGSLKDNKSFKEIWEGPEYRRMRDELAVINPTDKYSPCGECTRHCNHNRWLTKLHEEYDGLRTAGGDGDRVLNEVFRRGAADEVWL